MAEISASLVKALREQSGAGMMDCKKALQETDGDMEAAADWLRKKGLSQAQKKSARVAAEGLIGVASADGAAALVEVNAETDFVARNEQFQEFVNATSRIALSVNGDIDALLAANYPDTGRSVEEELTQRIATIGENMILRRSGYLSVSPGVVGAYMHNAVAEGLGKIGVIVGLESEGDPDKLQTLGKQLAMHIAAAGPQAVDIDSLDPEAVAKERDILASQARESGKPENIIEKMVEGRLRKFYEEAVLLSQVWVIDGESRVEDVLKAAEKDVGAPVKITGFYRFELGEMAEEPEEEDFAAEVAKAAGG